MPRNTITRDQIVRTAVELLDEEGMEGLNMRSLGKRLDGAATAVHWHVKNKDDLGLLAGDVVWHEIELPEPDASDWRCAAVSLAIDTGACSGRIRADLVIRRSGGAPGVATTPSTGSSVAPAVPQCTRPARGRSGMSTSSWCSGCARRLPRPHR
ncbi:TetR family transcriptional regulator [Streptomyces sp. NPDC005969]|uniref:TetR family transcriptional regulator n=1 Tax=Streptomyces sp. NPDC005969 TaxID=3156722 RepID=UPI0033CB230B